MSAEWPPINLKALEDVLRGAPARSADVGRTGWDCPSLQFIPAVRILQGEGARLLTLSALREQGEEMVLSYTFEVKGAVLVILRTVTVERAVDSLFSLFPAADFLEREVNNLFSVKFLGHPNLPQAGARRDSSE